MGNDSIELGRIRAKVLKLENKTDNISYSDSTSSFSGSVNITGNLEFARSPETKILFNSDINYGSDKAFILYKQDSAYHVNASNENSRLSIGVFNDNENAVGEGLDLQGAASLIFNVGQWDSELNNIIGGQYNNVLPSSPIKFRINNSDVAAFSSSGNFGIGTTSPLAKLSIGAGSLADSNVPVQINAPTGLVSYYGANNNGAYGALFGYDSTLGGVVVRAVNSSDDVSLVTNNTTRVLNAKSNGNVGIGTTSPGAGYRLHTYGANPGIGIQNSGGGGGWLDFINSAGSVRGNIYYDNASEFMSFGTNGNVERLRITSGGHVGIGTTSTFGNSLLSVGYGVTARDISGVPPFFQTYNSNAGTDQKTWRFGGDIYGGLTFQTVNDAYSAAAELFRINSDGKVGIGTPAPPSKFSVAGSQGNANGITVTSTDVATIITHDVATNGGMIQVKSGGSSTSIGANNYRLLLQPEGGNVGIGTTAPDTKLQINSTDDTRGLRINNTSNTSYAEIQLAANAREYRIGTGGSATGDSNLINSFYVYDATAGQTRIKVSSAGVTTINQESWIAPTFLNSFSNYGGGWIGAGFFKDSNGVVHLRGLVKNVSSVNANYAIFQLPVGYRPTATLIFTATGRNAYCRIDIDNSGNIYVPSGAAADANFWEFISLDGITFDTRS